VVQFVSFCYVVYQFVRQACGSVCLILLRDVSVRETVLWFSLSHFAANIGQTSSKIRLMTVNLK
jgi:hypothetical protein